MAIVPGRPIRLDPGTRDFQVFVDQNGLHLHVTRLAIVLISVGYTLDVEFLLSLTPFNLHLDSGQKDS